MPRRCSRCGAGREGADLLLCPELQLIGYPPEDLVLKPEFVRRAHECTDRLVEATTEPGPAMLIGTIIDEGGSTYNAIHPRRRRQGHRPDAEARAAELRHLRRKARLHAGATARADRVQGREDRRADLRGHLAGSRSARISPKPAPRCCSCRTAAPTSSTRTTSAIGWSARARSQTGLPIAYLNRVGGQDELVFDGSSFIIHPDGERVVQMCDWDEALLITDWERTRRRLALQDAGDACARCVPRGRLSGDDGRPSRLCASATASPA